jgi:Zn finger protein HypA/HybF involved in hydrogenase expression
MHEYSLVQAMFDQIGDAVRSHGAISVKRVRVRIGRAPASNRCCFRPRTTCFA